MYKVYLESAGILGLEGHATKNHRIAEAVNGNWSDGVNEYPIRLCYVQATIALTAKLGYFLFFNAGDTLGVVDTLCTTANVDTLTATHKRPVGVPLYDIPAGQFGWVATKGIFPVLSSAQIDVTLTPPYTSTTGKFDDATTSTNIFESTYFIGTTAGADVTINLFSQRDLLVVAG